MQKIHGEIRRVDASILSAVRQQSNSGTKAKEDLADATRAVEELSYKIQEIKSKAEQISAVEQLQVMASKKQYREAAAQLEVPFIFQLARLDKTERRYAWIKRRIRTNEEFWKIFPASWHVPYRLCIQFCKKTRKQVESILVNMKEKPEVATLLQALQSTVEFEKELENKFGGDVLTRDIGDDIEEIGTWENSSQSVSKIRKKYEKKFAAGQESGESETTGNKDLSVPRAGVDSLFNFHGIISSCFEPHLTPYIELEDKTLMEHLEKVVQEETWDIEYGSQNNVLHSSTQPSKFSFVPCMQLFTDIKKSLKRCSVLKFYLEKHLVVRSTLPPRVSSLQVFQRVLKAYATKLFLKLPKGGTGIVAAATGMDGQIKVSDRDERVICHIVNSSEYCHKTSGELAEKVSEIIDPHYVDVVDMSEVQDEFSAVITRSLVTLVLGIETKFDTEMAAMTRVPWGTLDSVGDQSGGSIPVLGNLLTPVYFQFFLDKLASSLGPRFYANIFRCKQLSEAGAQQMLLDTQAMKTILLEIPSLARQTSTAASYSKFVSREMSRAEALLKVILSPIDSVTDTYRALFPEGTPMEFHRILELKGLKKADQQSILDDFNKHGPGFIQPSVSAAMPQPIPTPPALPLGITNPATAAGFIANSEDVLTRAAALGRGAATTGFKKFIALTEAAKDRKDGPLRRLFNA
ncbi:hypothetical protein Bca4012_064753 [Brassica carinata]